MSSIFEIERHPDGDIVFKFKRPMLGMLSNDTRQHLIAAEREVLLALRSLLDVAIEGAENAERQSTTKTATKINVE